MTFEKELHKRGEKFRQAFTTYRLICDSLREIKKLASYGMSPELENFVFDKVLPIMETVNYEQILKIYQEFQILHRDWRDSKRLREILEEKNNA